MKKIYFFKLCRDANGPALELCKGYEFRYGKLVYGISKLDEFWSATEISTGLSVNVFTHKLKDIEDAFKKYKEDGTMKRIEDKILIEDDENISYAQKLIHEAVGEAIKTRMKDFMNNQH